MNGQQKPDEAALWAALLAGEWPRDAGARLNIPPNRVRYICLKWSRKGIYDYGVTYDLGWATASKRSTPEPNSV